MPKAENKKNSKQVLRKISILTLFLFLTSCGIFVDSMPKSWNWGIRPRPLTGVRGFPEADTDYGKGFKDGCGAAWDAVSKGLLSDFAGERYDFKLNSKSADYDNGWWDGMEQCTYILDWDVG